MAVDTSSRLPEFKGTKKQKERAELAFKIFRRHGAFYPDNAPIRISLAELSEYIREQEGGSKDITTALQTALETNQEVFTQEDTGDNTFYVTNRLGNVSENEDTEVVDTHSLRARFATPEPLRPRPVSRHDVSDIDSILEAAGEDAPSLYPADSWQAAVAAALADAGGEGQSIAATIGEPLPPLELEIETDDREVDAQLIDEVIDAAEDAAVIEVDPDEELLDVATASPDELIDAIRSTLSREAEVVRWGNSWMVEANIPRLSRGDLRKVQEYLEDSDGPLTDADIVSDLRGILPNDESFETELFGVNYRLSREVRDFEFIGTAANGLWTTPGQLEPIGTADRKLSDIGQDYRYLLDYTRPDEDLEEGIIEHILSYYEYSYGVLPLDANMSTLMPKSAYSEQRATRITFENPLTGDVFPAELRYPTGNRGGFICGLEAFFEANLVPGAVITIEATDQETHFIVEYFQVSGQDRKLLSFDGKKNSYVFVTTTFYCAVQDEMLLEDGHFNKLDGTAPVEERIRRRPEQVISRAFELTGDEVEQDGAMVYKASLMDLLAVSNIDRPISLDFLRDILSGGAFPEFSVDEQQEDLFIYSPAG